MSSSPDKRNDRDLLSDKQRKLLKGGINALENQIDKLRLSLVFSKSISIMDLRVIEFLVKAVIDNE